MIDIFIDTIPKELQKMRNLTAKMDYQTLKKTVHKVKPNFHYMGIGEAEGVFDSLESDLETTKSWRQIEIRINTIEQMAVSAIRELKIEKLKWEN